jgi:hypothetical protein
MYRLFIFMRYASYRPFTCLICYNGYGSYEDADIWDKLLAIVGRVMTSTRRKLRKCDQKRLYPVFYLNDRTEEINLQSFNKRNDC